MENIFDFFVIDRSIDRSTMAPKATLQQGRRKDAKNDAKTIQNDPKTIPNNLEITRTRSENCTFSDGHIASNCFEMFE